MIAAIAVLSVAGLSQIDPMRWSLPTRYLYSSFDVYRSGFMDFNMCMSVSLTEAEARRFVSSRFAEHERIHLAVPIEETRCPAQFWPTEFNAKTLGLKQELSPGPGSYVTYSSGAIYQDGNLYYWAWET